MQDSNCCKTIGKQKINLIFMSFHLLLLLLLLLLFLFNNFSLMVIRLLDRAVLQLILPKGGGLTKKEKGFVKRHRFSFF